MDFTNTEEQRLTEISRISNILAEFKESGGYGTLEEYILKPLERGAFNAFKSVKADDATSVIETQMMAKVIDMIRQTIDNKIQEGRLAMNTLTNLNSTSEGDEYE